MGASGVSPGQKWARKKLRALKSCRMMTKTDVKWLGMESILPKESRGAWWDMICEQ